MTEFEFHDAQRDKEYQITVDEVAKALSKTYGSKVVVKPKRSKFLLAMVAGLLLLIGFTGWDYERSRTTNVDGFEYQYYVRFLSFDLPAYKTRQISRTEYARERMAESGIKFDPKNGKIFEVIDGKLIQPYGHDLNKTRDASKD